ncbi:uncharacterized protein STEHIDRAFT_124912 [Stereum hirsutum FP-91666 SS1]|uniref:uncharacterized protein n=1 Tax=Stereum hirsutum (strain FP-91666) TaxID=721885 RepID=UPI000444A7E5|nr:uncharacterized protein STEHIDRAFT_124912 [Stereum hirsutum FP-91666 SS1]EIM82110.1 hypothetical protein STEHIDRAFT_124912 [Stereum hirsutum FP-91666 SS1]
MSVATAVHPTSHTNGLTLPPPDRYRGAVVEDLQLPPAFALPQDEDISRAIESAFDRDFSYIPVLDRKRKPLGYIDVGALKKKWEAGEASPSDKVASFMTKFKRSVTTNPYTTITPDTPLTDLEGFLKQNIFALVTDYDRKFVLAVATSHDLETFVTRRGI